MKPSEIVKAVMAGSPVVVVEYRSFKLETIKFRDKKTGAMVEKVTMKHALEAGETQMALVEWLADDADAKTLQPVHKKGDKCALVLRTLEQDMGFMRAGGDLLPLEPEGVTEEKKK